MERSIEVIYEDGVLRPLEPIALRERQRLTVIVSDAPDSPLLVSPEEWAADADPSVSHDDVRRALSSIRGSLSQAILDERRER